MTRKVWILSNPKLAMRSYQPRNLIGGLRDCVSGVVRSGALNTNVPIQCLFMLWWSSGHVSLKVKSRTYQLWQKTLIQGMISTSRNMHIYDKLLSSLKKRYSSQIQFYDEFMTKNGSSKMTCHICSCMMNLSNSS